MPDLWRNGGRGVIEEGAKTQFRPDAGNPAHTIHIVRVRKYVWRGAIYFDNNNDPLHYETATGRTPR